MPTVNIINESELRKVINVDAEAVECIEKCFHILATEDVIMPPILRLDIEKNNGEVDVKTAYLPGMDSFAIKISPGFFDNPSLGLPSVNGMMVLLSAKTGLLENVLLDNGYLTDVRTAAAGAVSVKHLSNPTASRIGIVGAGQQAYLQLKAAALVRPLEQVFIWARDVNKAEALKLRIATDVDLASLNIEVVNSVDALASQCDIIISTTPSTTPLLLKKHLKKGLHLTVMGSDAEHKNELDPAIIELTNEGDAVAYFCDKLSQVRILGELHHAIKGGFVDANTEFTELGEVVAGKKSGRVSESQITVCDLTGTGAQDTMIANLARIKALKNDSGVIFEA